MSPGNQLLDVVHVNDVVDTVIDLSNRLDEADEENKLALNYFLTSGKKIHLRDLADMYQVAKNVKLNINWGTRPYRKRELMIPQSSGVPIVIARENVFKEVD